MKNKSLNKILSIFIIILSLFIFYDIFNRINTFSKHYNVKWSISSSDRQVQTKLHRRTSQNEQFIRYQYYYYIIRVIQNKWINPIKDENLQANIQIALNKSGQVTSYELTQSSGNKLYDNKVIETVLSTTPFQPIPQILKKQELFLNIYFKGSGIVVTNSPNTQLNNQINQIGIKTSTPEISQIKKARIELSDETIPCKEELYNKWRPELTKTSNVTINVNVEKNGNMTITKIFPHKQSEATKIAINTINNTLCPLSNNLGKTKIKINFIVENLNDDPLHIFGPLLYKIFMN